MWLKDQITAKADVIAGMADDQDLRGRNAAHGLAVIWVAEDLLDFSQLSSRTSKTRGLTTTELMNAVSDAVIILAALWTS